MNHSSPPRRLSFLRRAVPFVALALSAGFVSAPAWAQSPVAGTSIGNQATATYNDGSDIPRNVQSNSVTTVVQQVFAVDLTDPRTISAAPGSPIAFPHTVQNNGNGTDSFAIIVEADSGFGLNPKIYADANQDGIPDNTTEITTTPALAPGQKFNFVIVGSVPGTQAAGTSGAVKVTTTSVNNPNAPAVTDSNLDTVNVSNNATISLRKSVAGPAAGGVYTYTLRYTNNSNVDASTVTITDTLNARLTYVARSGRSNTTGTTELTDATGDVQSDIDYSYTGPVVTATIGTVPKNTTGTISFDVTVVPDATTGRVLAGTIPNFAAVSYDDDNDNDPNDRVSDNSNNVDVTIAPAPSLTFDDDAKGTVPQGSTVTFANVLTNTGNATDIFDITFDPGNTFPAGTIFQLFKPDTTGLDGAATLLDSNGNGIADTGPLAPGATYNVIVKAKLPANASDAGVLPGAPTPPRYSVTLTGTSNGPGKPSDPATDTVNSISTATVEITNNPAGGRIGQGPLTPAGSPVLTLAGNPGSVVRFPLSANNKSASNDNYALSFTSVPALPAGYSVVFRDSNDQVITNTGNITPGAFFNYFADVTIPAGASSQNIELLFTITSGASSATDTIRDLLTVNENRALTISPNNQGQVFPGSSVNYAHTITNNGNATETITSITLADSLAGFSSVVYADNGAGTGEAGNGILDPSELAAGPLAPTTANPLTLAAGASFPVIVKVFGPSNQFTSGAVNTTIVTAATASGQSASATDITTIVAGDVTLTKSQSVNGGAQTQGNANALPGQTISYQILVRNTGGAPVNNVVVSDTIPAFTTYTTTGGAASYTIGGGAPVAGNVTGLANGQGAITWTIPTLNPGEVATVTFNVIINS